MCCCDRNLGMPIIEDTPEMIEHLRMFRLRQDIENRFTYHAPNPEQVVKFGTIRDKAKELANILANLCPDSPEFATSLEKLDEVVMWANASIIRNRD